MSRQNHDDQALTRYLLGSLPEAEAERLDELSVADDDFAERLRAAEKDLVDAYVEGELSGAALEQFKFHYLASPLRRGRVDFARAFRLFAEKEAATTTAQATAPASAESAAKRKDAGFFAVVAELLSRRPALGWGAAFAALLLVSAGGWLAFESARQGRGAEQAREAGREASAGGERAPQTVNGAERPPDTQAADARREQEEARVPEERGRAEREAEPEEARRQTPPQSKRAGPPSVATFVLTPQMRGAGGLRDISVPARTTDVAMRLELEPNDYSAYRVALLDQAGNRALWRSGRLRPQASGGARSLSVRFPAELLKQRTYVLRVTGVSAAGPPEIVGDYPFSVVK